MRTTSSGFWAGFGEGEGSCAATVMNSVLARMNESNDLFFMKHTGVDLYAMRATRSKSPQLKQFLTEMIKKRGGSIAATSPKLNAKGQQLKGETQGHLNYSRVAAQNLIRLQ